MSISTYNELQTAVGNWLHRSDLAGIIPDLITLGEGRIYRNVRVRQMEENLVGVTASGTFVVPTDYVALKSAFVVQSIATPPRVQWLERKSFEWIGRTNPTATPGIPRYIARNQSDFVLSPVPVDGTTIGGTYYKRLDTLSTALNDIFLNTPGLWLFAALCESAPFIEGDKRLPLWESKFGGLVREVNAEEYLENDSGSTLAMNTIAMTTP